jgi:hypothetical protein
MGGRNRSTTPCTILCSTTEGSMLRLDVQVAVVMSIRRRRPDDSGDQTLYREAV